MTKIYSGSKDPNEGGPAAVIVTEVIEGEGSSHRTLDPARSQAIRNHSPDGFQWGYGGSGPAQLALALLLDLGYTEDDATSIYQQFKFEVVAGMAPNWKRDEADLRAVADRLLKAREQ